MRREDSDWTFAETIFCEHVPNELVGGWRRRIVIYERFAVADRILKQIGGQAGQMVEFGLADLRRVGYSCE